MTDKKSLYKIIFHSDTRAGKLFDIWLLWIILFSLVVVILDSLPELGTKFKTEFIVIEWILTILFSIEYLARIIISPKPWRYVLSFWGVIDLLSILPTFLSLLSYEYHYFLSIRIFRLLRVFRILKLARFNAETITLITALKASSYKISIFFLTVVTIVTLMGTLMYAIEGAENGFTSIPQSIYWAIITITTVGYGDIVPMTVLGKFVSSFAMIIGYAIIAVPTGIITVEMSKAGKNTNDCPECGHPNDGQANYCNRCGARFNQRT